MKQLSTILTGILLIAVIILFALQFSRKNQTEKTNNSIAYHQDSSGNNFRIAFVNTDSLMLKYNFYSELKELLLTKQKEMESEFNRKSSAFESEAMAFQKKVQNNSFLSMESAQAQEQELYKKQQDLLILKEDLSDKLMLEEQKMIKQLNDSIVNVIGIFNATNQFDYIINNNLGSTLLHGNPNYDITNKIAEILNSRLPNPIEKK
jgi:outer membrane protein